MSGKEDAWSSVIPTKRLRFRTTSKSLFHEDTRIEDINKSTLSVESTGDTKRNDRRNSIGKRDDPPSLFSFIHAEMTRGYVLENDKELFSARREKVYSFLTTPREIEKFMVYGFLQCVDSFLFVYTYLPIRFTLAVWSLATLVVKRGFGFRVSSSRLKPAEICDILKGILIVTGAIMMFNIDTNILYHLIKSQSVFKLYILYNILEVGDRLFSAFGQDIIDALFWTATERRDASKSHFGIVPHLILGLLYVFLHGTLVLLQATTLNVAINSNNKAFLTIMMSNNFIELKGAVFKKFDKNNLFQVSCSDVRERFHLVVLLFIVVLQTMKEYSWSEERIYILLPDCFMLLLVEVAVDWIKHAFITRFNEIPIDIYRDYTVSLAYDTAQTRQGNAFSDHSDLVARRMGFIPLPLGVVMFRILIYSVRIEGLSAYVLCFVGYIWLMSVHILNSIIILTLAVRLIDRHRQEKSSSSSQGFYAASPTTNVLRCVNTPTNGKPKENVVHTASSPIHIPAKALDDTSSPMHKQSLSVTAIFSNSSVDLEDVHLNDKMFDDETNGSKSPSGGKLVKMGGVEVVNLDVEMEEMSEGGGMKRAESEPNILYEAHEGDDR